MQVYPVVLVALGASLVFQAVLVLVAHLSRARGRLFLSLALLLFISGILVFLESFVALSTNVRDVAFAVRAQEICLCAAAALSIDVFSLSRTDPVKAQAFLFGGLGVHLVIACGGFAVGEGEAEPILSSFLRSWPLPEATLVAYLDAAVLIALGIWFIVQSRRKSRTNRLLRSFRATFVAVPLFSFGYDTLVSLGLVYGPRVLPVASGISVTLFCFSLFSEFGRVGRQVAVRRVELRSALRQLHKTQAELVGRKQLAAVGELSAVIAHEVRNPLAIIGNATSALRRADFPLTGKAAELPTIVREESERLIRLSDHLVLFSKNPTPTRAEFDLDACIERSVRRAKEGVDHAYLVDVELGLNVGMFAGDEELLGLTFVNIIQNAFWAMPEGGTLRIRSSSHLDFVLLEFEDSGSGIDVDAIEEVFRPFHTTRAEGTGLGLTVVERIVRAHDGSVTLDSERDRGTIVRFELPTSRRKGVR